MGDIADFLTKITGVPNYTLRAGISLFGALPLAFAFNAIADHAQSNYIAARKRHIFSILSTSILFLCLASPWLYAYCVTTAVAVYYCSLIPGVKGHWAFPVTVFIATLGLLCTQHAYYQFDDTKRDDSGPSMILTIKLTMYAWSVYDGSKPANSLIEEVRDTAIRDPPTLLEFLGYILFFGGWLVGPAFEFEDYRRFCNNESPFKERAGGGMAALRTFSIGTLCLLLNLQYANAWAHQNVVPRSFDEDNSLLFRIWYINVAGILVRCKYYGAWKLAESACCVVGLNFTGFATDSDGNKVSIWNRVENVNIRTVECAQSPRDFINAWNKNTIKWLRRTIYIRVSPPAQFSPRTQSGETVQTNISTFLRKWGHIIAPFAVYFSSAFWHGLRPSYYFTFLTGAMVTILGQQLRRTLRPIFVPPSRWAQLKPVYDAVSWIATQNLLNYTCAPFPLYTFQRALRAWSTLYFGWHVILLVVFASLALGLGSTVRSFGESIGAVYPGIKAKCVVKSAGETSDDTDKTK
ncbi:MBOAT, membrane-bound O-acyltransferase family-domain-containing protein [Cladochytrium replicatum]|nr:MBOAT, membrane-bound O-acyltransferase family-domain-containing protein [Cladochytrium replicatum]